MLYDKQQKCNIIASFSQNLRYANIERRVSYPIINESYRKILPQFSQNQYQYISFSLVRPKENDDCNNYYNFLSFTDPKVKLSIYCPNLFIFF